MLLLAGLIALARRNGWAPMIGGLQVAYVREIRLWRRFEVVSSIETWEGNDTVTIGAGNDNANLGSGDDRAIVQSGQRDRVVRAAVLEIKMACSAAV